MSVHSTSIRGNSLFFFELRYDDFFSGVSFFISAPTPTDKSRVAGFFKDCLIPKMLVQLDLELTFSKAA